jgi:hypothetical protein
MKETRRQHEEASSNRNVRPGLFAILLWGVAASVVLASALVGVIHFLKRDAKKSTGDSYAALQFLPKVTYDSSDVTISNTQAEPYLDTSLIIYVDATPYTTQVGTVRPGETIKRPLGSLTNERGESFSPGAPRTSELEVRARFGRYDVHKDFPPPP